MSYDYIIEVDTSKYSGTEGDDAWTRDPVLVQTHDGDGTSRVMATNMMDIFGILHDDHHFEWLNLVVNNDLAGYEIRLSYQVDIKCQCGRWTRPRWQCTACYRYACWSDHHTDCVVAAKK